jgi:hypothetical protein
MFWMARRLRHGAEWLFARVEDLLALLNWDGGTWKPAKKDPRNGL